MSLELTGRKDYGYELAGIPVDDTIVNYTAVQLRKADFA
jgi:hypothetical protein